MEGSMSAHPERVGFLHEVIIAAYDGARPDSAILVDADGEAALWNLGLLLGEPIGVGDRLVGLPIQRGKGPYLSGFVVV